MRTHDAIKAMLARREELVPAEMRRLEAHLLDCRECRNLAIEYAQQDALLNPLAQTRPPEGLRTDILDIVSRRPTKPVPQRSALRWPVLAGAVLVLFLVVGVGVVLRSAQQSTSETAQVLGDKGYHLLSAQSGASVSRNAAERMALALFPGEVRGTLLASVRNVHTAQFRNQPRLCWIISVAPVSGTGLVPPGDTLLDGTTIQSGRIARIKYFLVFIDAKRGNFVLASSAVAT